MKQVKTRGSHRQSNMFITQKPPPKRPKVQELVATTGFNKSLAKKPKPHDQQPAMIVMLKNSNKANHNICTAVSYKKCADLYSKKARQYQNKIMTSTQ